MKYAIIVYVIAMITAFISPRGKTDHKDFQKDSLEADWEKNLASIREEYGDRLQLPADSVFSNIQSMKGMPATRLLAVMKFGYSRSLGVGCGHCHNTSDWASEEKPQIQITRQMSKMMQTISADLLGNIDNLESEKPAVNCTTCHRGQVKPALNLE